VQVSQGKASVFLRSINGRQGTECFPVACILPAAEKRVKLLRIIQDADTDWQTRRGGSKFIPFLCCARCSAAI